MDAARLRAALEEIEADSGLSVAELMRRSELSQDAWIAWKHGTRTPKPASLERVENALRQLAARHLALALTLRTLRET